MLFSFVVSAALGYHITDLFETDSSFDEFDSALDIIKREGFSGVELNLSFAEPDTLARIGDAITQKGLRLAAVGTGLVYVRGGLSFTDADSAKRNKAVEIVNGLIQFAGREHAVAVIGMVRGNPTVDSTAIKFLHQSVIACDQTASEHKTHIALEAINRYETSLLNTASEVTKLIQEHSLHSTGILLDTFHMNIEESSIEASIRKNFERISHFHIADSNRWPPGRGHLRVERLLKLLDELGYNGWVSAEVLPQPDNSGAVEDTANFLKRQGYMKH